MTDDGRDGHEPDMDEDASLDDEDAPLDEAEAAEGAAAAQADLDETLDERVGMVVESLDGVTRIREGELDRLAAGGVVFAVVGLDMIEVVLDPAVARAAVATAGTRPSPRGQGWVTFLPETVDRFALDRAEAWLRNAHRRAVGAARGH